MSAPEEIVVVGEAADPSATPAQVTVVPVDDRLPASADVATAIARAPGVVVRRLGGPGALAEVGIRGAAARHTEVLLDGIPLNPEGGAAVDLSELPLRALDRVEVYRGQAPALLGTTALGGAVALWTSDDAVSRLSLGGGSFGTARGDVVLSGPAAGGEVLAAVEALSSGGAFRWYDDAGTPSVPDDDRISLRENADVEHVSTVLRWRDGPLTLLHVGVARGQGVAGPVTDPTATARYALDRHLVGARIDGPVGAAALSGRAYGLVRREGLDDPLGELGVGTGSSEDRTSSLGLDAAARVPVTPELRVDLGLGGRADAWAGADARARRMGRAVVATPAALGPVEVVPAVQALAIDAAAFVLPRGGARVRAGDASLKVNAGAFARPPDLVELYGDRGALVGNPDLAPERGAQADLGVRVDLGPATAEVVGFHAAYRDLVVWVPGAQGVARAENVGRAAATGVEAAASGAWRKVDGQVNGTFVHAVDRTDDPAYGGKLLPRVPAVEVSAAGGVDPGAVRVAADLSLASGTWSDRANLLPEPARVLLGATLTLRDRTRVFAAEVDVRNALDTIAARAPRDPLVDDGVEVLRPVVDHVGYPLAGRSISITARIEQ